MYFPEKQKIVVFYTLTISIQNQSHPSMKNILLTGGRIQMCLLNQVSPRFGSSCHCCRPSRSMNQSLSLSYCFPTLAYTSSLSHQGLSQVDEGFKAYRFKIPKCCT